MCTRVILANQLVTEYHKMSEESKLDSDLGRGLNAYHVNIPSFVTKMFLLGRFLLIAQG